jgi:superfamily II DNA/RNA helicase
MLEMVRELAREMGHDCAWHTGDVPQLRRRAEIERFRRDPACRLFLSSDAGAVGLNLQVASAVINIDLPWNPAKLEQRIARVWRKHQTKAVTVINLVTEDSIEHSILHLLSHKQTLADGVLDGAEDFAAIRMPSGRAAMIERMQAMLGQGKAAPPKILSPEEAAAEDMKTRHGDRLLLAEMRGSRMIAVLDADAASIDAERRRLAGGAENAVPVEVIDAAAWDMLRRLSEAGVLAFTGGAPRVLHQAAPIAAEALLAAE